MFKQSLPSLD